MILFDEILLKIFIIVMLAVIFSLALILVMHILMPKIVLKTYFKEPYFSSTEIAMFTGIPFGYMRTAMFNRILGFPASGKRRGLENAYKIAPVWYCKASRYLILFTIPLAALMILLILTISIRFEIWK